MTWEEDTLINRECEHVLKERTHTCGVSVGTSFLLTCSSRHFGECQKSAVRDAPLQAWIKNLTAKCCTPFCKGLLWTVSCYFRGSQEWCFSASNQNAWWYCVVPCCTHGLVWSIELCLFKRAAWAKLSAKPALCNHHNVCLYVCVNLDSNRGGGYMNPTFCQH